MNEFDGIIKFIQSPLGRMLLNGGKDFFTHHLFPYLRNAAVKPVDMSQDEQAKRAEDEFATVDDFDIQQPTQDENKS